MALYQSTLNEHGLSLRQEKFVQAYFTSKNNGEAAIKAGYSAKNARRIAFRTLQCPAVQKRINEIQRRSQKMTEVTVEYIFESLKQIADSEKSDNKGPVSKKVAIEALKELNAMMGNHAPIKTQSLNVNATVEQVEEIKRLYLSSKKDV